MALRKTLETLGAIACARAQLYVSKIQWSVRGREPQCSPAIWGEGGACHFTWCGNIETEDGPLRAMTPECCIVIFDDRTETELRKENTYGLATLGSLSVSFKLCLGQSAFHLFAMMGSAPFASFAVDLTFRAKFDAGDGELALRENANTAFWAANKALAIDAFSLRPLFESPSLSAAPPPANWWRRTIGAPE